MADPEPFLDDNRRRLWIANSVGTLNVKDAPDDHNTVKTRNNSEHIVGILINQGAHRKPLRIALT